MRLAGESCLPACIVSNYTLLMTSRNHLITLNYKCSNSSHVDAHEVQSRWRSRECARRVNNGSARAIAETLCQIRNEIILITCAQSPRNHFRSKLAGSLVTLFVKYFHYLRRCSPATICCTLRLAMARGHTKEKRAIIGFILNRESII